MTAEDVIASGAKQSRGSVTAWIASSAFGLLAMTAEDVIASGAKQSRGDA